MNLTELKTRVRDLTGVYAVDVLSDGLLTAWLNEAYQELDRAQDWDAATVPWSYAALVNGADSPAFAAEFHPILAYRVAVKVLSMEADDSPRIRVFSSEYDRLLSDMAVAYFPATGSGEAGTLGALRRYVRFLTGAFGREMPNAMVNAAINEAYLDIREMQEWSWASSAVALASDGSSSVIPDPNKPVVAYLTASRLLAGVEGADGRVAEYKARVEQYLQAMVLEDRRGSATGSVSTRANIVRYVRDLLGTYNTEYSDSLLATMVNDAYVELSNYKPWEWLESTQTQALEAGDTQVTLTNGCRRVLEVYFVTLNGNIQEMVATPHLLDVEPKASRYVYDVDFAGVLSWGPALEEDGTLKVRYVRKNVSLPLDSSEPLFDSRFRPMLGLRVAARIAAMRGDDKMANAFVEEYQSFLDQMISEYLLDHDSRPFQLGGAGLETRKYLPWFRTA